VNTCLTDPDGPIPMAGPPAPLANGRGWIFTRYADVSAVLRSPAFQMAAFAERVQRIAARGARNYDAMITALRETMLFQNGEKHARARAVGRELAADALSRWSAGALQAEARRVVGDLPAGATVDAVPALGEPLPSLVLASLLGLDEPACGSLRGAALALTDSWMPATSLRALDLHASAAEMLIDSLQALDGPRGAIGRLATGHPDDSAAGLAIFMLIAGAETISGTIAAGLDILARRPEWQSRLRADPDLMAGFVRETLRLAGPIRRLNVRVAIEDSEIGGVVIRTGDGAVLRTDSAHRDPAVFPDPDQIDPNRKGAALLAFGGGAHICQGPLIGVLEAEIMIAAVLERFMVRPGPSRGALFSHEHWRVFATLPLSLEPAHG